jgi:Nuclease-related domain
MAADLRSPLRARPLRVPGQSVQEAIEETLFGKLFPLFLSAVFLTWFAANEWLAVWRHSPRMPWLYTLMAALALVVCGIQYLTVRRKVTRLRLGRDGERAVGQFLEGLRVTGARVFHDIPGDGFNIDHAVLTTHGFYAIETKTWMKPRSREARVTLAEHSIQVAGFIPDRDPVRQASASARWLEQLLEEGTGKRLPVRGVLVFPGWFVETMSDAWKASRDRPWVLEPKALPEFIEHAHERISEPDVALAAFHLSRYIRSEQAKG